MTQNKIIKVLGDIKERDSCWWDINKERKCECRRRDWRHFAHQHIQDGCPGGDGD
jgi:hypothetical protein